MLSKASSVMMPFSRRDSSSCFGGRRGVSDRIEGKGDEGRSARPSGDEGKDAEETRVIERYEQCPYILDETQRPVGLDDALAVY